MIRVNKCVCVSTRMTTLKIYCLWKIGLFWLWTNLWSHFKLIFSTNVYFLCIMVQSICGEKKISFSLQKKKKSFLLHQNWFPYIYIYICSKIFDRIAMRWNKNKKQTLCVICLIMSLSMIRNVARKKKRRRFKTKMVCVCFQCILTR